MKERKHNSLLGLAFENDRLDVVVLRRSGAGVVVEKSLKVPLTLDPLSAEPQLVAREIRNHLDTAGIRERFCAVCLPLRWLLTLQLELPALEEADLDGYIAMQTERSFPFPPEDLAMATTRIASVDGPGRATILALPRHHLDALQQVFKAAGLRPLVATASVAVLPTPPTGTNEIALWVGDSNWDLAVFAGGGIALLRSLEQTGDQQPDAAAWDYGLVAQQIRITLGGLPQSLRSTITTVRVHGPVERASKIATSLEAALAPLGLCVSLSAGGKANSALSSPAACAAISVLQGPRPPFDLLPPHTSRFQQLASRISARRAAYFGGTIGTLFVVLALVFGIQSFQLKRLESRWAAMKPRVQQAEITQRRVRAFRPWFDTSVPSLRILSRLAKAFPEAGTVWVKTIEIKDMEQVTCTGNAKSSPDWLGALEGLRKTPGIADLQVTQVRGESPVQFSLTFRWEESAADAR